jgi:putative ABC transport system substrate-binding protein
MRRRDFIAELGGAVAWSLAARAQQASLPLIGYLSARKTGENPEFLLGFLQGLREAGYVEGQNVLIEYLWAEGQYDRLPELANEFVRRRVTLIVADGTAAAPVAKAATSTIPIVFQGALNPVALGMVTSLNHPGGNATGVTSLNLEIAPKRLELLRALVPNATALALLLNPANLTSASQASELQSAARSMGIGLHVLYAGSIDAVDAAFARVNQLRAGGMVIEADAFFYTEIEHFIALAFRYALPAVYTLREFAAKSGVMSYGGNLAEQFRIAGGYAARILRGEKPGDLPVQQVTKVDLTINLKTANALGLTIPPNVLAIADEVIE